MFFGKSKKCKNCPNVFKPGKSPNDILVRVGSVSGMDAKARKSMAIAIYFYTADGDYPRIFKYMNAYGRQEDHNAKGIFSHYSHYAGLLASAFDLLNAHKKNKKVETTYRGICLDLTCKDCRGRGCSSNPGLSKDGRWSCATCASAWGGFKRCTDTIGCLASCTCPVHNKKLESKAAKCNRGVHRFDLKKTMNDLKGASGFMSSALIESNAHSFAYGDGTRPHRIMIQFQSNQGTDIRRYSMFPNEAELCFGPRSCFALKSVVTTNFTLRFENKNVSVENVPLIMLEDASYGQKDLYGDEEVAKFQLMILDDLLKPKPF